MKQVFEEPQMQVIKFSVKDDIVTTSPSDEIPYYEIPTELA